MTGRAKYGRGALLIIGIVYSIMGTVFLLLGIVFLASKKGGSVSTLGTVYCPLGAGFLLLGMLFLIWEIHKKKRADRLIASGRFIWGEVIDFVPNRNVRMGGRMPYIMVARYRDGSGRTHVFKSPSLNIYRNPDLIGKPVRIYISDESFRHYYVDAWEILPPVIEH